MFRSLVEVLEERRDGELAITFIKSEQEEKVVPYRDLYRTARGVLHHLQQRGLKPGDELLFQVENNEHFLYVFWACLLGKIIPVPVTVGASDEHKAKVFRIWDVMHNPYLVVEGKRLAALQGYAEEQESGEAAETLSQRTFLLEELLAESGGLGEVVYPEPDDIAFIQFSSGSTGDPKGVVLTHRNLLINLHAIAVGMDLQPGERTLSWLPLTHDMGMIGTHMAPLFRGLNQSNMETALFVRRPLVWFKKAHEHKAHYLTSPNFGFKFFMNAFKPEAAEGWDFSHVKAVLNGAEPISAGLVREFLDLMEPYGLKRSAISNVYGLAEASLAVTFPVLGDGLSTLLVDRRSLGVGSSVEELSDAESKHAMEVVELGVPVLDCFVRICDEQGRVLDENEVGFVHIRGGNVTSGYYNNPQATANLIGEDGWLNTGDIGFQRDGRLFITGRAKDIIFVQGQNYYPHDIERVVAEVEGVSRGEAAACGVFNEGLRRDEIHLFVLFKKKTEDFVPVAQEVKRRISRQIGLTVQDVLPVKQIPKTTSGKIQRYKLAEDYRSGRYDDLIAEVRAMLGAVTNEEVAAASETRSETEQRLLEVARDVLGLRDIGLDDNFTKFGVTSLQMTAMHERLDRLYPDRLKISDMFAYPSISTLADFVEGKGQLLLAALTMPEAFFARAGDEQRGASFDVMLDRELSRSLRRIAEQEGLEPADVLLAMYANLLHQTSGSRLVTVQSMIHSPAFFVPVTVDFEQVTDLPALFRWVRESAHDPDRDNAYAAGALDKAVPNRDPQAIVPFFLDRNVGHAPSGLTAAGDLAVEVFHEQEQIGLHVVYNGKRLNRESVKQLAVNFVKVAKLLSNALAQQA